MLYITVCTVIDSGELQYTNIVYVNILNVYIQTRSGSLENHAIMVCNFISGEHLAKATSSAW